jgi:hypothetical protein
MCRDIFLISIEIRVSDCYPIHLPERISNLGSCLIQKAGDFEPVERADSMNGRD